ncbi:putative oxidoreductase [Rubidibacter lacunae KORDI 51-2]|uniref:Putative oxidoreductase n=1 Tax=Rubidibacter lacunae KORDI 51-2 TaxID=582515 RepID=U5DAI1_9CHRO|nr:aldo/keto reductase [Rubidibacter lacunae]ERN41573.1 putative oxidoreductase [Rubidibacter lacunae KORDI 51-2]
MKAKQTVISAPLIVGCWQLDDRSWTAIPANDVERTIDTYLAWGIAHFDTADIYGRSERLLGQILKDRSDCTLLTKAVFFGSEPTPNQVRGKIENSLRQLQRDCLDCVQVHWHDPQIDFAQTLELLTKFQDEGKIRQLGATNFDVPMLKRALEYAPIATHQVQYSLVDRRVENGMAALCQEFGIGLLPYGPLAGGFLSDKFLSMATPPPESSHARGFYYSSMVAAHGGWPPLQELLHAIAQVARKYELTIAQVALKWVAQQPGVLAPVVGFTQHRQQIEQNVSALKSEIAPADLEFLSERSAQLLQQPGDIYSYERK